MMFANGWGLVSGLQVVLGLAITLGGWLLAAHGMDRRSPLRRKAPLWGLSLWGLLFAMRGATPGHADGIAANALAALIVYVLVRHGRQIRGILDGEEWWPPNAGVTRLELRVYMRPRKARRPWVQKLNPLWVLFGNDDDGVYGDDQWRNGRGKTWRVALDWWLRNPCHNLTWYVIGVADRERVHRGRWAPDIHKPGGGWLFAMTDILAWRWRVALPFVSYISPRVKAYAGWRPSGAFGFKLNVSPRGSIEVGK